MEMSNFAKALKRDLEKYIKPAVKNKLHYSEAISLATSFMALLIARCTTREQRLGVIDLIRGHLIHYEEECRSNIEDLHLMVKHNHDGPPKNPISGG